VLIWIMRVLLIGFCPPLHILVILRMICHVLRLATTGRGFTAAKGTGIRIAVTGCPYVGLIRLIARLIGRVQSAGRRSTLAIVTKRRGAMKNGGHIQYVAFVRMMAIVASLLIILAHNKHGLCQVG